MHTKKRKLCLEGEKMNDRTFENLDGSKTTYHSDGSKSKTFDNLDSSKTTYHSDGSKARTFKNLDGSYTTIESNGNTKHTYEKIDGSYVTYDSNGNKAHTYENPDGSYSTSHSNSYNSVGGAYYSGSSDPLGGLSLVFAAIMFGICTILGFTCAGIAALPLAIVWIADGFACIKLKKTINSPVLIGWAELISLICYIILNVVYWNNAKGASMAFGLFGLYIFIPVGLGVIYVKLCESNKDDDNQIGRYTLYVILNFYCVFNFALMKNSAPWMIIIGLVILIGVNVGRTLKAKKKGTLFVGESQNMKEAFNKVGQFVSKAGNTFTNTKEKAKPLIEKAKSVKDTGMNKISNMKRHKAPDTQAFVSDEHINPVESNIHTEPIKMSTDVNIQNPSSHKIPYTVSTLFYGGNCKLCNKETDIYYELTITIDGKSRKALLCPNCCQKIIEKIEKQ